MNIDDLLATIKYKPNNISHLIPNQNECKNCTNRVCEHICPAKVYEWDPDKEKLIVTFENCLECGACRIACPLNAIDWNYPKATKGITFKNS